MKREIQFEKIAKMTVNHHQNIFMTPTLLLVADITLVTK